MRDQFETWAKDFVKGRDSNDRYTSPYTQAAWEGWQAARQVTDDMVQIAAKEWGRLDDENEPVRPDQRRPKYVRAMLAKAFTSNPL